MDPQTRLRTLEQRLRNVHPHACGYLRVLLREKDIAIVAAQMAGREQRHRQLFWRTFDEAAEDIAHLLAARADVALDPADSDAVWSLFPRAVAALPHKQEYEEFEDVCESLYGQAAYPFLEHSYYLGLHGIDRLARVLELVRGLGGGGAGTLCDLGVGPAVIFAAAMRELDGWRGIGFDISPHCVGYAREVALRRGIDPGRFGMQEADARRIPVGDAAFDLVIATEVVEHVPDPDALLAEIRRVLRPGGRLTASTPTKLPWGPHLVVFEDRDEVTRLYEDAGFACREMLVDDLHGDAQMTFALLQVD